MSERPQSGGSFIRDPETGKLMPNAPAAPAKPAEPAKPKGGK